MSVFKICQPCRAYNLQWNQNKKSGDKHERREDRMLGNNNKNNNNDGDGVEQARYNCYDAAGYTNVNQCYKFETKTSMAIAEPEDMARASEQGSILLIKAYGNVYGEGGYVSPPESDLQAAIYISLAVSAACGIIMGVGCIVRRCCCRARECKIDGSSNSSLGETFYEDESDFDENETDVTTTSKSCAGSSRWNRFRRKQKRVADKDIESGGYTPPSRPETPPWLNATSVSSNSFEIEIEMKYCTFHNETANGPDAGNCVTVSTLPEIPIPFVASLPPPLPESLVSNRDRIHVPDEEVLHNAIMERSNLIGNEAELSSSGNDSVQITEMATNNPSDSLIASPMTESESVNHNIESNNASECDGSTENNRETIPTEDESSAVFSANAIDNISTADSAIIPSHAAELITTIDALHNSPSLPIEEVAAADDDDNDSVSFAAPALLLVIVIRQQQEAASVLIQSKWRRAIALKSFRRKRNAAIICQRNLRRWVTERRADQPRSLNGK